MADAICNGPPPSFVREDLGAAITLARYLPKLKAIPGGPQKLSEPFSQFLEDAGVSTSVGQKKGRANIRAFLNGEDENWIGGMPAGSAALVFLLSRYRSLWWFAILSWGLPNPWVS